MKSTHLAVRTVDIQALALAELLDGGFIDIFDGQMPPSADTPLSDQMCGVSLQLGTPAFATPDKGAIAALPIAPAMITNSILATWARIYRRDHVTAVMDVSVGTANANIVMPIAKLSAGINVSVSSFVHEVARGTAGY